jgi:PQQ enzyme repeat
MPTAVTTHAYNSERTGVNPTETALVADAVGIRGVRRLFSLEMAGDARGVEAQPLVVPGVELGDGGTHDVVYLADMANQVWAFDAQSGAVLWKRQLGTPVKGTKEIDMYLINDHWGILSTPVIDEASGTMYLVAWISPDGSVAQARHFCCAVSLRNGDDVQPPIDLEGATYEPSHGAPPQRFASATRKQRAGLLLTEVNGIKTVFIGFGSINETSESARGWVIACSTEPFAVSAAWAATARGFGGGIWQAAGGLVADSAGFIYAMTGNGTFDGEIDFAESFVKLRYEPDGSGHAASLTIVDWWTPFSDELRTANQPDAELDGITTPTQTNYRAVTGGMGGSPWGDMDLGSAGPVVIEEFGAVMGAGKDGIVYVLHKDNMGKTQPADLQHPAANYAKLMAPPVFFTYYPPGLDAAPQDIETLNTWYANQTHHLHGGPVLWNSPDLGPLAYCWGENGNLRAWSLQQDGVLRYLACSAEWASMDSPDRPDGGPKGGMPGGMISLSADSNVAHTGVVWATIPYADANMALTPGRLLAYDASQFDSFPEGGKQLRLLWDSQRWNLQFTFNKFNRPVVANGKLLVPTYDGRVDVYGLA